MASGNIAVELLKKGGRYIFEHPEKIAKVALVAGQIFDKIAELREKYSNGSIKEDNYTQFKEENNIIQEKIIELESRVYELAEYYDNEFVALETKNDELVAEIKSLKEELQTYKSENEIYKKNVQTALIIASIVTGIGIVCAIVLATVL